MFVIAYMPSDNFGQSSKSISSNLFSLVQQYSLRSIYFIYRMQRIYLNTIGNTYLDDPTNWSQFGTNIIIFYLSNEILNGQQFFYSTQNLPNVPVYFNPLNFYETSLVQTDGSYYMLTVNNRRYKIFSCGKTIFSFIIEGIPPNATGTTEPALLQVGSDAYFKVEPNGKELFTSSTMKIIAPNNFNQIIYYPLDKSLNNVSVESLQVQTKDYEDYVDQAVNLPVNSRYFLQQLSNNINIQPSVASSGLDVTQNAPFKIDTVFCSKIPQIGCATVQNMFSNYICPYTLINRRQMLNLHVDSTTGNIVTATNTNNYIYIYDMYYSNYSAGIEVLITYTNVSNENQFPTRVHYYDLNGSYINVIEPYKSPLKFSGSRLIFEWDNASELSSFDIPCQSINAMLYLTVKPPVKLSIRDAKPSPLLFNDYLSDTSGHFNIANGILSSSRGNFGMILMKVYNTIRFASGALNHYSNDQPEAIFLKNISEAQKLAEYIGMSKYTSAFTDQNPFNLGIRIMPNSFDFRSYFKFNHLTSSSITIETLLSEFVASLEFPGMYELSRDINIGASGTILPQFREIGCVVSPSLNTNIESRRAITVYASCVDKRRGQLRCLFIEQQDKHFIMFYPITNFKKFKIYINSVEQRQEGVDSIKFTLLLK
jgi:hypothetical protein